MPKVAGRAVAVLVSFAGLHYVDASSIFRATQTAFFQLPLRRLRFPWLGFGFDLKPGALLLRQRRRRQRREVVKRGFLGIGA